MAETFKTARGHREPYAVQFSVFLANRVGQLKDLAEMFSQKGVPIIGMSIIDSTDWAVVRLITADATAARALLSAHTLPFTESHVLLVEIASSSALPQICTCLLAAEINVHFAYTLMMRSRDNPVMVFHVDDHLLSTQILSSHGFTLLADEDLLE